MNPLQHLELAAAQNADLRVFYRQMMLTANAHSAGQLTLAELVERHSEMLMSAQAALEDGTLRTDNEYLMLANAAQEQYLHFQHQQTPEPSEADPRAVFNPFFLPQHPFHPLPLSGRAARRR